MKKVLSISLCMIALVAFAMWAPDASAFQFYSVGISETGNCADCHGGFNSGPNYFSNAEGVDWGAQLHEVHLNNTTITGNPNGSCSNCHDGAGTSGRTVNLSSSGNAKDGVNAIGCSGCHGRLEDANTVNTNGTGWGAGLRQHHFVNGTTTCLGCHADSDPANYTTAGEEAIPAWYVNTLNNNSGTLLEPCNAIGDEQLAGITIGLDNDGDNCYDAQDTDCGGPGCAAPGPELSIPDLAADAGQAVTLPVTYTANGNEIAAIIFSVDFDEANLIFDSDNDGLSDCLNTSGFPWPDGVTVNPLLNPFVYSINVTCDLGDTDGELDFTFADFTPPFTALPEGDLATITFTAGNATAVAPVNFSNAPAPSFGNTAGDSVAGTIVDGSVDITGTGPECGNGIPETGEDCDDGTANGDTICGCQTDCTLPTAGTSCDDGEFCNGTDTCDGNGACQVGTPVVCDDGVGCTDDSCDEAADVCVFTVNDGNCDDGLFCNGVETCDATNDCQAGTPVNVDDGVACTDDSCDEATDSIVNTPNDGNCDNGQFCDGSETCDPNLDCQAGTAPSIDDGVPCTDDSCDEATDSIVNTPNDGNCDNGQFCDGSETCDPVNDCQAGTAPSVDDGVACTDDSCDEVNDVIVNAPNDGFCDNGLFCDGSETCDPVNDCQAGTPPVIDDGVGCTDDSCDEVNDVIVNAPNDGLCDNGQFCDGSETCDPVNDCQAGTPPVVDDGVGCTDDSCDEVNDVIVNAPNDGLCDNGQFCDGSETCDPVNDCQAGTPPVVDDGVGCTDDSCDEATDSIVNTPNDGLCDNGQFCDGSETCDPVNDCQAGTPPVVDDGVGCTDDSCDEANDVIVNTPNDGLCDNGQFCDGSETCDPVNDCQAGTPPVVDDGVGCTDDSCDEATDSIVNTPNDGLCDNGQFCDGSETCDPVNDCQAGTPPSTDDGVACTDDSCDEVNDVIVNAPNDGNCDNGQFCDGSETCDPVNDCQAGTPPVVDDGVGCTDDSCDEATDTIVNTPNDGLCDNGQFCDGSETCDPVNDCQAGTPPVVDDGVGCTDDSCDEANDVIVNTPNDGLCDNGQFCDGSETCDPVNDCQAGTPPVVDDGVGCTDDSCDEATDSIVNTPNDGLCDNGAFCDGSETCDPVNDCQAGTPPSTDDGVACTDDSCDEVNDVIVNAPNDGNCDNGQFCDGSETCDPDLDCQVGTPPSTDDGVGCTDDSCDEATDTIVNTPNDGLCDNGAFCDGSEICDPVNDCQAGTPPCDPATETCDDGNDICVPLPMGCAAQSNPDQWCNDQDGNFCNGVETCNLGTGICQSGTPVDVDDGVGCTVDSCDEVNDVIVNVPNDGLCDNGQFCDGSETCDPVNDCQAGTPPVIDDGVGCTVDSCDEVNDIIVNAPNDGLCDDEQFCNGSETCDPVNDCQAGTPPVADDGVGCTDDSCDEANDVIVNAPNDGLCDNGEYCDGSETCDPVNDCQAGTPPCNPLTEICDEVNTVCVPIGCTSDADCNDDISCTVDACDQSGTTGVCINTPDDGLCDNSQFCDGSETCDPISDCQAGTPPSTDDGVPCTDDSCDEATDTIVNTPNDGNCDNGQFCDGSETCDPINDCQAGTPPSVDDGVPCTDDSCNEATDTIVNTPNDGNCDNGQFCDGSETCDPINDCQAGIPVDVDDGVACTDDSCDEANDVIVNAPNDGLCDNGQFCDGSETCDPNLDCQPGADPCPGQNCIEETQTCVDIGCTSDADCDDGVSCTEDTCDQSGQTGVCVYTPNDGLCDNGQFCDGSETCDPINDCQAGTPVDVDDGVACTDDSCDEINDVVVNTPNDGFCDNGEFCDGSETCDPVNDCQAGTPPVVDDGVGCTDDYCDESTDTIVHNPNDGFCDNGDFCDGLETCDPVNDCQAGTPPCDPDTQDCNEVDDICRDKCLSDAECDNGLYCDGAEICDANGFCQPGIEPCFDGEICDEDQNICIQPTVDIDIVKFHVPNAIAVGKEINKIKLTVENANGPSSEEALARVTGIQDGKQVYYAERTVWDITKNGKARFGFPSYTPIKKGKIDWTLVVEDGYPDDDTATASTNVK